MVSLTPVLSAQSPAADPWNPRLVVVLTIDQMRPDYFERFGKEYTGGLKRLATGGALFTRREQDHAITETAPGHSTLLTWRSPGAVNVITNELGGPDEGAPLVGVPGPRAWPVKFRGTTLYDWMKAVAKDVNLLRRPILIVDKKFIVGFDKTAYEKL